jgi:hypothetical protein
LGFFSGRGGKILSTYDGQFIALALEMGVPCVTEDRELQEKFPGVAVSMEEFLEPQHINGVRERKGKYRAKRK